MDLASVMLRTVRRVKHAGSRFLALPRGDHFPVIQMLVLLAAAEVSLRVLSIERAAHRFGVRIVRSSSMTDLPDGRKLLSTAERHRLELLDRVAARWPFGPGPCLRQALVQGHFLREREPGLRLGVRAMVGGFSAHAWIEIDGCRIDNEIGYRPFGHRR